MDSIDVLAIGSEVRFGEHASTKAKVDSVTIHRNRVVYGLVFWEGDDRITRELEEHEFVHDGTIATMKVNLRLS